MTRIATMLLVCLMYLHTQAQVLNETKSEPLNTIKVNKVNYHWCSMSHYTSESIMPKDSLIIAIILDQTIIPLGQYFDMGSINTSLSPGTKLDVVHKGDDSIVGINLSKEWRLWIDASDRHTYHEYVVSTKDSLSGVYDVKILSGYYKETKWDRRATAVTEYILPGKQDALARQIMRLVNVYNGRKQTM